MKTITQIILMSTLIFTTNLNTGCATRRGFPAVHGIENFDKVDDKVYRGAQPNAAGIEELSKFGVKTVINLRRLDDVWFEESAECARHGMRCLSFPMSGTAYPHCDQVESVLLAINESSLPVFVHCQYGADRTGTIVACYRIRKGESVEEALNDAKFHGMSPLSVSMKKFIRGFK